MAVYLAGPPRSVLFVAFDGEEAGLVGSRELMRSAPVAKRRLKGALILDRVGTAQSPAFGAQILAMGAEKWDVLTVALKSMRPVDGVPIRRMGLHLIENVPGGPTTWSDYGPFRDAHVPFVFLSTQVNPSYGTPADTPASLSPELLTASARYLQTLLVQTTTEGATPRFNPYGEDWDNELQLVSGLLNQALHPE